MMVQCPPQPPPHPHKWSMHKKAICLARRPTCLLPLSSCHRQLADVCAWGALDPCLGHTLHGLRQSGGQNQKWPTSGQIGYLTPAVSGIPAASERGAESEVAHKLGKVATSPLPYRGSPPLQSGGQNQNWPTSGQIGYLTPAVSGIPAAAERGAKSEVAHKWANWLPHPCRLGDPRRCRAGGKIRNVQKKSGNATSPLHCGVSLAKGTKSKVAELGARTKLWMCSPKEQHQKKNRTNDVCASKNTLKTPPRTILKKGGGFQNPPRYRISQKPPPPAFPPPFPCGWE